MMTGLHHCRYFLSRLFLLFALFLLAACAGGKEKPSLSPGGGVTANPHYKIGNPYKVAGIWYYPSEDPAYDRTGIASWYGPQFHGKQTANGEIFDMNRLTAAHPTLPLPSIVQVTNLKNGRTLNVRLNDRGPFAHGRIIDMSREAADKLGFKNDGLAEVRVRYVGPAGLDHAVTGLGQPEAYADGTYAMPRAEALRVSASDMDTVHMRIASGPEIKLTEDVSGRTLDETALEAARASARKSERMVFETAVPPGADPGGEADALPDFNEVMDVMGATPADDVWMVQVGAFADEDNARKAASRFGRTIKVHHERIVMSNGSAMTLVRLGPYLDQSEAEAALRAARHSGFDDAHIVAP